MFCKKCGKMIPDDAAFCSYCGAETERVSADPVAFELPEVQKQEERSVLFDEFNWNVNDYPNTNAVSKTEDVNFDWSADPKDIRDRYTTGELKTEDIIPQPTVELPVEPAQKREELSAAQKIDQFYTFSSGREEFQKLLDKEYEKSVSGNPIESELSLAEERAAQRLEEKHNNPSMDEFLTREGIDKPFEPQTIQSDILRQIEAQEAAKERAKAEEEARKKAIEEARAKAAAEAKARLEAEAEAKAKAEAEARAKAYAEAKARMEAEARAKAAAEAKARAEEARRKAEEEARRKIEEEARLRAEEEARLRAEEEARLRAEEEARLRAEEEARLRAEEEARLRAEEEARLKAEEEARLRAEEEARLRAEEEARLRAEEEARLRAEEEARLRAEEEARLRAEEEARLRAEEEARFRAEEEARLIAEARIRAEEEARIKAEEAARVAAEAEAEKIREQREARLKAEEERRLIFEEERRRETERLARERAEQERLLAIKKAEEQKLEEQRRIMEAQIAKTAEESDAKVRAAILGFREQSVQEQAKEQVQEKEDAFNAFFEGYEEETGAETAPVAEIKPEPAETDDELTKTRVIDKKAILEGIEPTRRLSKAEVNAKADMDFFADLERVAAEDSLEPAKEPEEESVQLKIDEDLLGQFEDVSLDDFESVSEPEEVEPPVAEREPFEPAFTDPMLAEEGFAVEKEEPNILPELGTEESKPGLDNTMIMPGREEFTTAMDNEFDNYGEVEAENFRRHQEAGFEPEMLEPEDFADGYEEDYYDEEDDEEKGGKGRIVLKIILILLIVIFAIELVGIGIRFLAPQSRAAEIIDTQVEKVLQLITGEESDYTVAGVDYFIG